MNPTSPTVLPVASKPVELTAAGPVILDGLRPSTVLFAMGMLGLGVLALLYGDFALVWQPVAPWVPGRTALAYGSGGLMCLAGGALLAGRTRPWAVRILFPYLIVWTLLKVPALVVAPQIEAVWLGFGELAMLLAGGWVLFARYSELSEDSWLGFAVGDRGVRIAKYLFAVWVIPVGLSHFFYTKATVDLIPQWIPGRMFFAYLTGAGHVASGLGVLFSVLPEIALIAEAAMLGVTLLVWAPRVAAHPAVRLPWTAFWISWAIASAVWVIARQGTGDRGNQGQR